MSDCWLRDGPIHPLDHVSGWEMQGRYALRAGRWKVVRSNRPWGTGGWELFDIDADPGETRDLAAQFPDVVSELLRGWDAYVVSNNVICADDMAESMSYSNMCLYYEDLRRDLVQ